MTYAYQLEAPDGSLLITKDLITEATNYLSGSFGQVWPIFTEELKQVAAAACLVRAMGYQQEDAPKEILRLGENPYFVDVCNAFIRGYELVRDLGLIR